MKNAPVLALIFPLAIILPDAVTDVPVIRPNCALVAVTAPEVETLPAEILPVTATDVPVIRPNCALVAVTMPEEEIFPAVTLPDATTDVPVMVPDAEILPDAETLEPTIRLNCAFPAVILPETLTAEPTYVPGTIKFPVLVNVLVLITLPVFTVLIA